MYHKTLVSIKKTRRKKKLTYNVQTTHGPISSSLPSLGPVFVAIALPSVYLIEYNLYMLVSFLKKTRRIKKTHLGSKRRVWRRLDPFSSSRSSLSHIAYNTTYIYHKTLVSIKNKRRKEKKNLPGAQDASSPYLPPAPPYLFWVW